jgi:dCTP deaminase
MSRQHAMIEPFADRQVREGVISYGVSSYGYDMRVAPEFKIFTNALSAVVDPKPSIPSHSWNSPATSASCRPTVRARELGQYFRIPRNCLTICVGSTRGAVSS